MTGAISTDGGRPLASAMGDFFVCDFFGVSPKHDLASMEHPIFSLSTRPDRRILTYDRGGVEVTVTPSVKGRATIFDADILIFLYFPAYGRAEQGRAGVAASDADRA